jgi:hypothetical protein
MLKKIYTLVLFSLISITVMAQEVEQVMPQAVMHHADGYMMVNYGRINA